MSIPSTSTRRPVAVAMLFLAVILLGIISFVRLPIDLLPGVSYPRVVVYTTYPDVAPAEVEGRCSSSPNQPPVGPKGEFSGGLSPSPWRCGRRKGGRGRAFSDGFSSPLFSLSIRSLSFIGVKFV